MTRHHKVIMLTILMIIPLVFVIDTNNTALAFPLSPTDYFDDGIYYYNSTTLDNVWFYINSTAVVIIQNCDIGALKITLNGGKVEIYNSTISIFLDFLYYEPIQNPSVILKNLTMNSKYICTYKNAIVEDIVMSVPSDVSAAYWIIYSNTTLKNATFIAQQFNMNVYGYNISFENISFTSTGTTRNSNNLIMMGCHDSFIKNFTFKGNLYYEIGIVILIPHYAYNITIDGFNITYFNTQAIENDGYNTIVRNGYIAYAYEYDGLQLLPHYDTSSVVYPHNQLYENITIEYIAQNGISVGESYNITFKDITIRHIITDNYAFGFFTNIPSNNPYDHVISQIFIDNITFIDNFMDFGVSSLNPVYVKDILITNYTSINCHTDGIHIENIISNWTIKNSNIHSNIGIRSKSELNFINCYFGNCRSLTMYESAIGTSITITESRLDVYGIILYDGYLTMTNSLLDGTYMTLYNAFVSIDNSNIFNTSIRCTNLTTLNMNAKLEMHNNNIYNFTLVGHVNGVKANLSNNYWYNNSGVKAPDNPYGNVDSHITLYGIDTTIITLPYTFIPDTTYEIHLNSGWNFIALYTHTSIYNLFEQLPAISAIVYRNPATKKYIYFQRGINMALQQKTYILPQVPLYLYLPQNISEAIYTIESSQQFNYIPESIFNISGWHLISIPYNYSITLNDLFNISDTIGAVVIRINGQYYYYTRIHHPSMTLPPAMPIYIYIKNYKP